MKVYLIGELGEKFGSEWTMDAARISDVFNLISCQRKGFKQYIIDKVNKGVNFTIQKGEDFISEEELELSLSNNDLIITAIPAGSGSVGKIVIGVILLVTVAWALAAAGAVGGGGAFASSLTTGVGSAAALNGTGLALASIGLSLVMGGIQELLLPEPGKDGVAQDSYLFSSGTNAIKEGFPVPVVYGELEVVGKPISVNYVTEKPEVSGWNYSQPGTFHSIYFNARN